MKKQSSPADIVFTMSRPSGKSRVAKPKAKPVDGEMRERKHGDHTHSERWCATHNQWEPAN